MAPVVVELTTSLDGFIAGPNDGPHSPLGEGGDRLFSWMSAGPEGNRVNQYFRPPDASMPVIEGWNTQCGAIISGRRTFDIASGWKGGHPIDVPIFVVTHEVPTEGEWSPRASFLTEGLGRAIELEQLRVIPPTVLPTSATGSSAKRVSRSPVRNRTWRTGH